MLVAMAFLFNVIVGIFGISNLSLLWKCLLIAVGLVLTVATWYVTLRQSRADEEQKDLIRRIAIANGIDINQPIQQLAEQSLKKQLGNEAVEISREIFELLAARPADAPRSRDHDWDEAGRIDEQNTRTLMNAYDQRFTGKTLSLRNRLLQLKLVEFDSSDLSMFEHPTNPLGIRHVASALGKVGQTLLAEAK